MGGCSPLQPPGSGVPGFQGQSLWQSLPLYAKESPSVEYFKKKISLGIFHSPVCSITIVLKIYVTFRPFMLINNVMYPIMGGIN